MAKVTRRKKTTPAVADSAVIAAAAEKKPRIPRESTRKGLSYGSLQYKDGQDIQRRVFRELKRTIPHWSSLSVAERVRLNLAQIKKLNLPKALVPGVVSQMGVHYFTNDSVKKSAVGQEALAEIESSLGGHLSQKTGTVVSTGVVGRRAMGRGNVYDKRGRVKERTGKARGDVLRSEKPPRPTGGYGRDRSKNVVTSTSTTKREIMQQARDQAAVVSTAKEQAAAATAAAGERYIPTGTNAKGKPTFMRVSAAQGDINAIEKGMHKKLSSMGSAQNRQRLVDIAKRYIADFRAAGKIPSEGGYTALLMNQPHFKDIDSKELRSIIKQARNEIKQGRVTRTEARRAPREVTNARRTFSVAGGETTGQKPPRMKRTKKVVSTRSGQQIQVSNEPVGKKAKAVANAEMAVATERLNASSQIKKDRKAAQIRGEQGKPFKPAKAISRRKAAQLEQAWAAGQPNEPVVKRKSAKAEIRAAVKESGVRVTRLKRGGNKGARNQRDVITPRTRSKLSMLEQTQLSALEKAGSRAEARRLVESLGMSPAVKKIAKSHGLMGVAATFGANYILSLLGEKKKNG